MVYIFSNCRTKLPYNVTTLGIKPEDTLIFMNTAWLLTENLEYFKQFANIELYVRAIYDDNNVFKGYCNPSAGNYLKDVTDKFNRFSHIYGMTFDFGHGIHYREDLRTGEKENVTHYFQQYPAGKSPTTGFMLYLFHKESGPVMVNFFNDDTKKNYFLNKQNKDMYSGHNWAYEKAALRQAKKVFLW